MSQKAKEKEKQSKHPGDKESKAPPQKAKKERSLLARVTLITLFVLVGLVVVLPLTLRIFVLESFKVSAASMAPTLLVGDHFFVSKLSYKPQRGDVVVFRFPPDPNKDFVKRIIGLPQDRLRFDKGDIWLNGKKLPQIPRGKRSYLEKEADGKPRRKQQLFFQEVVGKRRYLILREANPLKRGLSPTKTSITVKAGHVFVLGDNRDHSSDSRDWGQVPLQNIKGRVTFIWLSLSPGGEVRNKRIFQSVE